MNPYDLAADTNKQIDANCIDHFRIADVSSLEDLQAPERVQVLNYLRTVRTHIELLEYFVIHDAPKI